MSLAARPSHRGDDYQVAIAVNWLARLLIDPELASVDVDATFLPGQNDLVLVDDIVVTDIHGKLHFIQSKKNQPRHTTWSLSDQVLQDELRKAHSQWKRHPDCIIEFVSRSPFGALAALVEANRDYPQFAGFQAEAPATLSEPFKKLSSILLCAPEESFSFLRRLRIGDHNTLETWQQSTHQKLENAVTDRDTAVDVLAQVVRDRQTGLTTLAALGRHDLVAALSARKISVISQHIRPTASELSALFKRLSLELLSWPSRLPDGQWLDRPELESLQNTIEKEAQLTTVLLGLPGCGKSALLATLGTSMLERHPVLAIRADRLPETVSTRSALNAHLDLPLDIVAALRLLAHERKVVVLIDQLDALSDLVVQHTGRLDVLLSLIREIHDDPNIHVVVSCRSFDYSHDPRLQGLDLPKLDLELPSWEDVAVVLANKGIGTAHWNEQMREDLRSPHVLNLFLKLISGTSAEELLIGYQQMLDRLWNRAVLSDPTGGRRALMVRLSEEMARREVLWLARTLFEDASATLDQLVQAGVLTVDGGRVGFFHQTFYEFVRAKMFLANDGQLTQAVLERQDSLRVRPQLWHALAYMRATDLERYETELRLLVNAPLRSHLRALLVEFVGQHQNPLRVEQSFVSSRFEDPWFRKRILAACAGSAGWFSFLARAHLPTLLDAASDEARHALHVLIPALKFARDAVLEMVDAYWMASDDKRALALFVLQSLPDWQLPDIQRLCDLAATIKIDAWAITDLASAISTQFPEQAVRPVARWLALACPIPEQRAETDDERPIDVDPSYAVARDLLSGHSMHALPAVAEAAPGPFLDELWRWFQTAMNAFAREENEYTRAYRTCVHLLDDLDDDDGGGDRVADRHPFLGAVLAAVTALAINDPARFLRFLEANAASDLMVVQRLLALGLIAAAKATAPQALRFLLADRRRFELGSLRDALQNTKALIRAIAPHLDAADFSLLEEAVLAWQRYDKHYGDDDAQTRFRRTQWNREYRLILLQCLPPSRRSVACAKLIAEERRALPDAEEHTNAFYEGGAVGSPVNAKQMAAGSDDNIVALFKELTDETGWSHPKGRARALAERGGAVQAGRELGALAKTDPARALRIAVQLDPANNVTPVGEVLRGLGESAVSADSLYTLILELDGKGFDPMRIGPDAGWALQNKVDAEHPFPDALFDTLDRWLDALAGTAGQPSREEKNEPQHSLLWDQGGMAVLPHGSYPVLAAVSLACLRADPPMLARWQEVLLRHLDRQESPSVWLAMHRLLKWLGMLAREDAERIIVAVVEHIPAIFSEREGLFSLALARWWVNPETYKRWLQTASRSDDATTAQGCGELIALCAMRPAEQQWAPAWLTQLCAGASSESIDWVRVGVAHGLVHLWNDAPTRVRAHPYLIAMLQSTDPRVLAVLGRVLDVDAFIPDATGRALLEAVEAHPTLMTEVDAGHFAECLLAIVDLAPETAARCAMKLLQQNGDAIGNAGHVASSAAEPLVSLALKLQEIPEFRAAGADLFERILEINLPHAQNVLIELDKRTANAAGATPAARRRRLRKRKPARA